MVSPLVFLAIGGKPQKKVSSEKIANEKKNN